MWEQQACRQRRRELQAKGTGGPRACSQCMRRKEALGMGVGRGSGRAGPGNCQAFGHGDFRPSEKYSAIKNKLLTHAGHLEPQSQRRVILGDDVPKRGGV